MRLARGHIIAALLIILAYGAVGRAAVIDASFQDVSLREALIEVGRQAGVDVLLGNEVTGSVSLQLRASTVDAALNQLLLGSPFTYTLRNGFYIVGAAHPSSPLFQVLSVTQVYNLRYVLPEQVAAELVAFNAYVAYTPGRNLVTVTAASDIQRQVADTIRRLDTPANMVQVRYRLHVVELSASQVFRLGLDGLSWQPGTMGDVIQIIAAPSTLQMINGAANLLQLQAASERTDKQQVVEPTLTAVLGSSVELRILEERHSLNEKTDRFEVNNTGFTLAITPISVEHQPERVLSRVKFDRLENQGGVANEVWVPADDYVLIAVAKQTTGKIKTALFSHEEQTDNRYFALYLTAQAGGVDAANASLFSFPVAGMAPFVLGAASQAGIGPWPSPTANGRIDLQLTWPTEHHTDIQADLSLQHRLFDLSLWYIDGRLSASRARQLVALGLGGRAHVLPYLQLAAGVYQPVYQSASLPAGSPVWWAVGELRMGDVSADLRFESSGDRSVKQIDLGYWLGQAQKAFAGYSRSGADGYVALGLQFTLGR